MRNERTALEPPPTNRQPVLPLRTPNSALRTLFVSQRDDRIERRRAPRRPDAEEQPHRGAEHEGEEDGERGNQRIPVREGDSTMAPPEPRITPIMPPSRHNT